ncbi:hypothetical protein BASA81_002292 [Batrachochytrium salamandrivorans]|nr:hypothetical protein BASA81_002292 [Batrachochytrium salamandrivorans]
MGDFDAVRLLFDEYEPTVLRKYEFPRGVSLVVRSAVEERPGHLQTGIILWPGASALAHYLCAEEFDREWSHVVELGAGCGLSGLCAAAILDKRPPSPGGSSVLFTDRDWTSLKVIKDSAVENKFAAVKIRRKVLMWTEDGGDAQLFPRLAECDLAIGSDLIYSTETARALFCTLHRIMPPHGRWRFILCNSFRHPETTEIIDAICAKLGLARRVLAADFHQCLVEQYTVRA